MPLPNLIEQHLSRVGNIDDRASRCLIEQRGDMRLKPDSDWVSFTAEQWFSVREVAFCWHARVKMAPLVTAVVEDAYEDGEGRLDAKLWGAIPLAHDDGPEVDRGEVQRYLAELPWNPAAFRRNEALNFEETAADTVRVWTGEPSLYVDLTFDPQTGDVVRSSCNNRPFGDVGPRTWEGVFADYRELGGLRVPTRGEVSWLLPEGQYTYWRGELLALEYVE